MTTNDTTSLDQIYSEVKELVRIIRGHDNTPGIMTRLTIIELFIQDIKEDQKKRRSRNWEWTLSLVAPVITGVIVAIIIARYIQ
jgi:hypothetical protein